MNFLMIFLSLNLLQAQIINSHPGQERFLQKYLEGCIANSKKDQDPENLGFLPEHKAKLEEMSRRQCKCIIDYEAKTYRLPDFEKDDTDETYFKKADKVITNTRHSKEAIPYLTKCANDSAKDIDLKKNFLALQKDGYFRTCENGLMVKSLRDSFKEHEAFKNTSLTQQVCSCVSETLEIFVMRSMEPGFFEDKKMPYMEFQEKFNAFFHHPNNKEIQTKIVQKCWDNIAVKIGVKRDKLEKIALPDLTPSAPENNQAETMESLLAQGAKNLYRNCMNKNLVKNGSFLNALDKKAVNQFVDFSEKECVCAGNILFATQGAPSFNPKLESAKEYSKKIEARAESFTKDPEKITQQKDCTNKAGKDSGLSENYFEHMLTIFEFAVKSKIPRQAGIEVSICVKEGLRGNFMTSMGGEATFKALPYHEIQSKTEQYFKLKLEKNGLEDQIEKCLKPAKKI